jgi:hypothetical protein
VEVPASSGFPESLATRGDRIVVEGVALVFPASDLLEISEGVRRTARRNSKGRKLLLMSVHSDHSGKIHREIFQKILVPPEMRILLSG